MQLDFIPQVFYDVVARFVPGAALVASWSLVAIEPTRMPDVLRAESSWLFGFGPLLLFIVASYLVGLLTAELWELTVGRFAKKFEKEAEQTSKRACLQEHKRVQLSLNLPCLELSDNDLPREFVMHDHLREVAGAEAMRLLKLRAERRMCQVLVAGFILIAIANSIMMIVGIASTGRIIFEVILLLAAAGSWRRAIRITRHLVTGTCVLWLSKVSAGLMTFQNTGNRSKTLAV